jgi:hypothetical protein
MRPLCPHPMSAYESHLTCTMHPTHCRTVDSTGSAILPSSTQICPYNKLDNVPEYPAKPEVLFKWVPTSTQLDIQLRTRSARVFHSCAHTLVWCRYTRVDCARIRKRLRLSRQPTLVERSLKKIESITMN